ncbi:hypothetical protein SAMN04487897_1413 [Paenibacillus sp. yr247]|uniref:hypothetical protein n=1 Tax=Paenibacillus sp. yr247 TaxID=1761880 RepID=UPI00089152D5|nr:hypothetical protein [Paenibacillus sp. yr247]SDP15663.1 hypothetical protein SAMN04487897_1413 [Paenibacillus sp. yr247]
MKLSSALGAEDFFIKNPLVLKRILSNCYTIGNKFLRDLIRNYITGSGIAVVVVGGVIISTTLTISNVEMLRIFFIMITSLCVMMLAEFTMFRRHMRPIREMLEEEVPDRVTIREAYLQTHRFPALSVKRILGPHFLGLSIPAMTMASIGIAMGWLSLPAFYIGLAGIGALLVASMHALLEFFRWRGVPGWPERPRYP